LFVFTFPDHRYDLLTPPSHPFNTEKKTKGADDDDADDRVQDRLAKHFDKRARRNRMLEEYGKEEEDETKRLYEEDNFCLKTVKVNTIILYWGCFVQRCFLTLYIIMIRLSLDFFQSQPKCRNK